MKRCPKCSFLYLDTDEVCDLDGSPLVQVNESVLEGSLTSEAATASAENHEESTRGPRRLVLTAISGLMIGVILAVVYFLFVKRTTVEEQAIARIAVPSSAVPPAIPESTPSAVPESSSPAQQRPSPSPSPKAIRANVSDNPVSTSANHIGQSQSVIRLTNGARIDADEVWRTKEGVWYRKNGIVTLVKANQIRAIEKSARK